MMSLIRHPDLLGRRLRLKFDSTHDWLGMELCTLWFNRARRYACEPRILDTAGPIARTPALALQPGIRSAGSMILFSEANEDCGRGKTRTGKRRTFWFAHEHAIGIGRCVIGPH
jgi:hypothetical protein